MSTALFEPAFERMIRREGGFKLTDDPDDRGGQTYAGIARKKWPAWRGWPIIDTGNLAHPDLTVWVKDFYMRFFWVPLACSAMPQQIAEQIFDFGVNAGVDKAAKLAQVVAGVLPDGRIGPKTIEALEAMDADRFAMAYALAKIARYCEIVGRDKSQLKYLRGWTLRALEAMR